MSATKSPRRVATPPATHRTDTPQTCTACETGVFYAASERAWIHDATWGKRCPKASA